MNEPKEALESALDWINERLAFRRIRSLTILRREIEAAIPVAELHEKIIELLVNDTLLAFIASIQNLAGAVPDLMCLPNLRKDYEAMRALVDKLEALKCTPQK